MIPGTHMTPVRPGNLLGPQAQPEAGTRFLRSRRDARGPLSTYGSSLEFLDGSYFYGSSAAGSFPTGASRR